MHAAVSGLAQKAKAGGVEMKQRQRDEQPAHQHGGRRHHRPKLPFGIEFLLEHPQLLGSAFRVGAVCYTKTGRGGKKETG